MPAVHGQVCQLLRAYGVCKTCSTRAGLGHGTDREKHFWVCYPGKHGRRGRQLECYRQHLHAALGLSLGARQWIVTRAQARGRIPQFRDTLFDPPQVTSSTSLSRGRCKLYTAVVGRVPAEIGCNKGATGGQEPEVGGASISWILLDRPKARTPTGIPL